jgi:phosphoglycerate dehydrogenase-like enzyme
LNCTKQKNEIIAPSFRLTFFSWNSVKWGMTNALHVHLLDTPDPVSLDVLRAHLDTRVILTTGPNLPPQREYHILVAGRPDRSHLTASPSLHTLIIPFAGLPAITRTLMLEFPHIAVHNLHHNAALTAEMALALLLSAAKFIIPFDRALRSHDWTPRYSPNPSLLLEGKTALVLGFGAIGKRVARACWGMGMHVIIVRRQLRQEPCDFPVEIYPASTLTTVLPRAHVLVIALPATPETEGLIGATELALMPHGSVLVNIGRGPIVEQHALFDALKTGRLAAAGLDVWYNYPTDAASRSHTSPADLPFHELSNVVMSPHRAGHALETEEMRMIALAQLINTIVRGEPVPDRVDIEAGY